MVELARKLTLETFLQLPQQETGSELIDGEAVVKMSPPYSLASLQTALVLLQAPWAQEQGRIRTEWSVLLCRKEQDWVPVPDFLDVSYQRFAADWFVEGACPLAPELVVEIISPDSDVW